MILPPKKQARVWCILTLYKLRKLNLKPPRFNEKLNNADFLSNFFNDNSIFVHDKGDYEYFYALYDSVEQNFQQILSNLSRLYLNELEWSIMACFYAELRYLCIEESILNEVYPKIFNEYGEKNSLPFFLNLTKKVTYSI